MDINAYLEIIFRIVIIPLLSVLVRYVVKWINAKAKELKASTDNIYANKYIGMLQESITNAVIAINQTYVNALKDENIFDAEAQKEAFTKVYNYVIESLTEESLTYLQEIIGDLDAYITNSIEATVNQQKMFRVTNK